MHTNKVARSVFSESDLPRQIDGAFAFFGDQPFSWWIGPAPGRLGWNRPYWIAA